MPTDTPSPLDAAWRARAEAAVKHSDAALAAEAIWEKWRHRKTKDLQDAEDATARRLVDYAAARRRYEKAASNPRGREVVDG